MDQIIAIIALIIGWGLNELTQLFRTVRAEKAAIANALSILLEVRYQAVYIENMLPKLKEHGVSDEQLPYLRRIFEELGPNAEELSQEYEEAMRIVSSTAPLLAYEYRSKASLSNFFKRFRDFALQSGVSATEMETVESQLKSLIIPRLDELVLELAQLHSKKSQQSVKAIIESPFELPEAFENYLKQTIQT